MNIPNKYHKYTNIFKCNRTSMTFNDRSMDYNYTSKYGNPENYRNIVTNSDEYSKKLLYRTIYDFAVEHEHIKWYMYFMTSKSLDFNEINDILHHKAFNHFVDLDKKNIFTSIGVSFI